MKFLLNGWSALQNLMTLSAGLRLARNKPGLPCNANIETLGLPNELILPLLNYRREGLTPCVIVGEHVTQGQLLADGLVASASGLIIAIEPRPVMHPSQREALCVVIKPDSKTVGVNAIHAALPTLTLERLTECGVAGLGGAGFATSLKLYTAQSKSRSLDTLIINAVECEPMISCDEALMMCEAASIIQAIDALIAMTRCRRCVLAIENDKQDAIQALRLALEKHPLSMEMQLLPPVYPAGAERLLIQHVTGLKLGADERPAEQGIVCINVATTLAAWHAQSGYPLTSRVVTLAGDGIKTSCNVRVAFGTSVKDVLQQTGNEHVLQGHEIRVRGPLSGFDIENLNAPITATTNCIGVRAIRAIATPVLPCIRCGACSDVCPEQLLPQQLYWHAQADNLPGTKRYGLDRCIECGCCDIVCPSSIPLTHTFRYAKDGLRELQRQAALATLAEQRYQAREQRLIQRTATREKKRREAKAKLSGNADPIADALARARQRRKPRDTDKLQPKSPSSNNSQTRSSLPNNDSNS